MEWELKQPGMTRERWVEIETDILGHPPDISKCPVPELKQANAMAHKIYHLAKSQLIVTGLGDIVGVDLNTVLGLLDLYEAELTEDKTITFEKVYIACNIFVEFIRKKTAEQVKKT